MFSIIFFRKKVEWFLVDIDYQVVFLNDGSILLEVELIC